MSDFNSLLTSISALGIERRYLLRVLPEWMLAYPPTSTTELVEAKVLLSTILGLDLEALLSGHGAAFATPPSPPLFKRALKVSAEALTPAAAMFGALARSVASAVASQVQQLPADPEMLRVEVLKSTGLVCLESLLTALWQHGIPVVHFSDLPDKFSRPDAMVMDVGGRPCVVVGGKRQHAAWQLFYVAHEAGHIALGHLTENGLILDADIDTSSVEKDDEEDEANKYGLSLLAGSRAIDLPANPSLTGTPLARQISKLARDQAIDAGHLLLRFAAQNNAWAAAGQVLNLISVDEQKDGPKLINRIARAHLDWGNMTDEGRSFVARALCVEAS
ncbi:ImmA/IrrE family metallo-endopeptidase [Stagnimonas aquatica]|uniref:ImmA/IrrE family metallo-endopeptidase n=1 Tax=Stagnimonas aquatica TaxID=2689987 RepID=UPI0011CDC8C8|nr:hypothetical protein [Stagnimonas aquatica]